MPLVRSQQQQTSAVFKQDRTIGVFEQPSVRCTCTPSILECAQPFALQRHHLHLVTHGEIERPTWTTTWTGCRANHLRNKRQSLVCDSLSALKIHSSWISGTPNILQASDTAVQSLPWPNGSAHDTRLGDLTGSGCFGTPCM